MWPVFVATSLLALLFASLYFRVYRSYYPFGDDPALLVTSANIRNFPVWFSVGMSRDFEVFPE